MQLNSYFKNFKICRKYQISIHNAPFNVYKYKSFLSLLKQTINIVNQC
jgi:hypothetical protein